MKILSKKPFIADGIVLIPLLKTVKTAVSVVFSSIKK